MRRHGRRRRALSGPGILAAVLALAVVAPPAVQAETKAWPTVVIIFRLTDEPAPGPFPATNTNDARDAVYTAARDYYRTQTWNYIDIVGVTNPAGDVWGPYDVNGTAAASGNPGCFFSPWSNDALNQAIAQGLDFTAYKSIVYIFDSGRCQFAGVGGSGTQVWINGLNSYTIIHELGHTFGNGHASSYRCVDANNAVQTLTGNCTTEEYGDPFDPMGSGAVGHGTPLEMEPVRKLLIGALTGSDVRTANTPGQYVLVPAESSAGTRMLRLPAARGDLVFDLSFRQATGPYDSGLATPFAQGGNPNAINGVTVTLDDTKDRSQHSLLLDMTPQTPGGDPNNTNPWTHTQITGFEDAPLPVGQSFSDPYTGLTLTVNAVGATGATVTIDYGQGSVDVATPSAPGTPAATVAGQTVQLSWAAATDAFGVTSYTVQRDGTDLPGVSGPSTSDTPGPGTHTYTVRAADAAGNVSPASGAATATVAGPAEPDTTAPAFRGKPVAKLTVTKNKHRKRLRISIDLSEAAKVDVKLTRAAQGVRKRGKCVKPPRKRAPGAKRCTRHLPAGSLTRLRPAGASSIAFAKTGLAPGSYTATLLATDAAGNASRRVKINFRVA